jgi:hypothetical protein
MTHIWPIVIQVYQYIGIVGGFDTSDLMLYAYFNAYRSVKN